MTRRWLERTSCVATFLIATHALATHARAADPKRAPHPNETARTQAPRPKSDPSQTPPSPPASPASTTLTRIARELARALGQVPSGVTVIAAPLIADVPAPRSNELTETVTSLVAGGLPAGHAHQGPVTLGVARAIAGRSSALLYLRIELSKGSLHVTGDLYPVVSNVWDRLRNPAPEPRAHAFARGPVDAELRTYLAPIVLEHAKIIRAKTAAPDILAIACGDLDDDGGLELVTTTPKDVAIARLRGGRIVVERTVPWSKLASRAPSPLREPLASLVIAAPSSAEGRVFVGTTDRGGVVTDKALLVRAPLSGLPIAGTGGEQCALARAELAAFEGPELPCRDGAANGAPDRLSAPLATFDAIAKLTLVDPKGVASEVIAQREPSGKIVVRTARKGSTPEDFALDDVGAQIALADLDQDGVVEIITTRNASTDDAIIVASLDHQKLTERLRIPAKDGVRALAVCPPEEGAVPALVAVVGSEVLVVR